MEIPKRNVVADSTMINGYVKGILRKSYNLTLFRGSFGGGGGIGRGGGLGGGACGGAGGGGGFGRVMKFVFSISYHSLKLIL